MVTTVKQQNPFEYSWWVIVVAAVFAVIAIVLLIYVIRSISKIFRKIPKTPAARKIVMSPYIMSRLKDQYAARIQNIVKNHIEGKISKRDGYQELSSQIRGFVHEATGINVENLTAKEIKALGIRNLDLLMEEYYVPEFAEDDKAKDKDLVVSCNAAIGVIRSWS